MRNSWSMALGGVGILALAIVMGTRTGRAQDADENRVPLVFSGGHEIGRKDFGRPVALIAAALKVKPDQFRKAFSGVRPAKGGPPSREEARKNKQALMKVLQPLGVTNERLDEVSNYYRYRPQAGELWPTKSARGYAVIENGKIARIVITEGGSGYCSLPEVSIKGIEDISLKVSLHFDTDFEQNGAIEAVEVIEED